MKMDVKCRFESKHDNYVGVLSNSTVASGRIASQNAGSSLPAIYYQVGGTGINGVFASAIGPSETVKVNAALVNEYDARFGAGSWTRDQQSGAAAPLTSLFVPIDPAECAKAGTQIAGMVYSVGPQLTNAGITDESQYREIYTDAFVAIVAANAGGAGIGAVRITMVSTGIYSGGSNPKVLATTAARLILDGIEQAASTSTEAQFPGVVLINAERDAHGHGKEVDAFGHAAGLRSIAVDRYGFDLDVTTAG